MATDEDRPTGPKHDMFSNLTDGDATFVEAYLDQIKANIRDHGWAVQGVFPSEEHGDREQYCFAYTVGLIDKEDCFVELLVTGLPLTTSASILNQIAQATLDSPDKMPPETWELEDGFVMKRVLHVFSRDDELQFGVARLYHHMDRIPVAQYVWPSKDGVYPWESGWPAGLPQPVGGTPPNDNP